MSNQKQLQIETLIPKQLTMESELIDDEILGKNKEYIQTQVKILKISIEVIRMEFVSKNQLQMFLAFVSIDHSKITKKKN